MNPAIVAMIRASGRSWWQARYSTGRVLSEWDTLQATKLYLPVGSSKTSRWEDIPKQGMIGLRLLCPNGMAGELEAPEGHKFLQLKVGHMDIIATSEGKTMTAKFCEAHIIGIVRNDKGDCLCRAWEVKEKRLLEFWDNIFNMTYRGIGLLSLDVQGLKI